MSTNSTTKTSLSAAAAIVAVGLVIAAVAMALVLSSTVQEVQAQGPPPKAQLILSTPPSERGAVASGDHGRPCAGC